MRCWPYVSVKLGHAHPQGQIRMDSYWRPADSRLVSHCWAGIVFAPQLLHDSFNIQPFGLLSFGSVSCFVIEAFLANLLFIVIACTARAYFSATIILNYMAIVWLACG